MRRLRDSRFCPKTTDETPGAFSHIINGLKTQIFVLAEEDDRFSHRIQNETHKKWSLSFAFISASHRRTRSPQHLESVLHLQEQRSCDASLAMSRITKYSITGKADQVTNWTVMFCLLTLTRAEYLTRGQRLSTCTFSSGPIYTSSNLYTQAFRRMAVRRCICQ